MNMVYEHGHGNEAGFPSTHIFPNFIKIVFHHKMINNETCILKLYKTLHIVKISINKYLKLWFSEPLQIYGKKKINLVHLYYFLMV